MTNILSGIRVLDFGRYIAGPYCATILSDFGAEVIRIEKLDGSEDRYITPMTEDQSGDGAMIMQMGQNKKGLTLNPMKPEGRDVVKRLVKTADVVVANLPIETLEAMGLDYDSLKAIKEDIILTHGSVFGDVGPYKNRVGFDGLGQAMSGVMYMTGDNGEPRKLFGPWVDYTTAMMSALGTMAALRHRDMTGEGQLVTTSLFGSSILISSVALIEQEMLKINRVGTGNRGQNAGPADTFKTKDGWVLVQALGQPLFERWAKLMGEDHWLSDPRFTTDQKRGDNNDVLSDRMAEWCAERTTEQALAEMEAIRLPCGPVLSPQQVLDDPHLKAMGLLTKTSYPGFDKEIPVAELPIKMSKTDTKMKRRAPTLGEHTDEIMESLGYSADEIAELRKKRVV
ncbi:MAG: formyl-CoA transferase [Sneathiella sp.]|jgi:crotonobetainyl-CoA:carnitine CoA-transferase CaiB-like acyl-CoA transferase|uniref:CaiB/BaiF CoA transferase family protein n=1 Tax=Sneathiella sp. TaxID=1964365 RepID=UPI000C6449F9|nr:CoA transferase [Sneathiella sp.]MAL78557.1 formyl-CoA transferase [Sneathiella sp.]